MAENRSRPPAIADTQVIVLVDGASPQRRLGAAPSWSRSPPKVEADPDVAPSTDYARRSRDAFVSPTGIHLPRRRPAADRRQREPGRRRGNRLEPRRRAGGQGRRRRARAKAGELADRERPAAAELLAFPICFRALPAVLPQPRRLAAAADRRRPGDRWHVRDAAGRQQVASVSVFALNLVTGLGLGLAIDYSLFIVSRYREEIARTGPGAEAMRRTMATAGRTVFFSSLTVAGALASLASSPSASSTRWGSAARWSR